MKWNNGETPYKIVTERLVIKCWEPRYAQRLLDEIQATVDSLLPWMPFAKPPLPSVRQEIDLLRMFRGNYDKDLDYVMGIFDPTEEIVIGSTGLHTRRGPNTLEIGYWIGSSYQGKGYATETASALIKTAFALSDVDRVEVNTAVDNLRSQGVIKKLGVHLEGVLRSVIPDADGKWHDEQKWSILRGEYEKSAHKDLKLSFYSATGERIEA